MKNNPNWSAEELALLATPGLSNAEVAARTGRSQPAVRGKRQRLAKAAAIEAERMKDPGYAAAKAMHQKMMPKIGEALANSNPFQTIIEGGKFPSGAGQCLRAVEEKGPDSAWDAIANDANHNVTQPAYEQDRARVSAEFWRNEHAVLKRKYERALKETAAVDRLVEVVRELAPRSYDPAPRLHRISAGAGKPQSAVLFLSDTHVGKVVHPHQTMGFGGYDFETFLARLKFYEEAVTSIIRDHTTTDITELVIAMGGDMLDGALKHAAEVGQQTTLFQQWFGAGHAFAQFIRNLAPLVPKVRIYCTVGNHTRWADQHKMPTENRYSNLDSMVYAYTQALTSAIPTVEWFMDEQPFSLFAVQNFIFHLSHGDNLRGGDRALGIPNHAVGRMVSATSQLYAKTGAPTPHYYLVGHLHREIVLPHSRGSVIVNGGFPGVDGFGLATNFSPVDPKQVFFLVHPRYGKTATYDIELKFAEVKPVRPYVIPGFI